MPSRIQSATLATGVTLPYVEQGEVSAVPVLLLHGYTDSWRFFELVLSELPGSVHAFVPTQRGHGDAAHPVDGYRQEDFVADLAAFMDEVELEGAIIAGQSSGGYTAQRFAIDHPDRTLGLVLIGAPHDFRDKPPELQDAVAGLRDPVSPEFVRRFVESIITKPVPQDYLETLIAEALKVPARVWQATLQGLLEADVPTESGQISVPTLLVWGEEDEVCTKREQEDLVAAIPGAALVTYPGAGHSIAVEEPERAAADIATFAEGIPRR